jgi:tetraacyldisaccharide-1-P 4'-kinase
MLAEALPGVPVLIGKRRVLSAAEAVRRFGTRVCILDDGFQYWRLKKDMDLVLIDALCPFGGGYLLPRGLLRESTRQLRRAHAMIITNSHRLPSGDRAALCENLRRLNPTAALAEARHVPSGLRDCGLADGPIRDPSTLPSARASLRAGTRAIHNQKVLALSSLGNPEGFEQTLADLGAEVVPARYPDHHHYRPYELRREVQRAQDARCTAIVTTEKDAVKLEAGIMASGRSGDGDELTERRFPIWILSVELQFEAGWDELEARLKELLA